MLKTIVGVAVAVAAVFLPLVSYGAGDSEFKITNRVIYEKLVSIERRLTEIEKRQAVLEAEFREFKESTNKRFEAVDKRFEDINRRFEELRDDMNKRFEQLYTILWIITGIFTALVAVVIGFAYWDRKTIIRVAREETIEYLEREGRLRQLIEALRELAKEDVKLAKVLKQFGLF